MIRRWHFGAVEFCVNPDTRYAATIFPDGAFCSAIPGDGEGDDWFWHDFAHSWLCHRLGQPHSQALWAVAHDEPAGGLQWVEEGLVNEFVAFMKDVDHFHSALAWLFIAGTAQEWRAAALAMLEGS